MGKRGGGENSQQLVYDIKGAGESFELADQ